MLENGRRNHDGLLMPVAIERIDHANRFPSVALDLEVSSPDQVLGQLSTQMKPGPRLASHGRREVGLLLEDVGIQDELGYRTADA
jgi:hypothetical protein